jgi:Tat protein secretion system quality control protein TatD with DNase activity
LAAGDHTQTRRAVELGCYFSVTSSMVTHLEIIELLPIGHVLTETDHPSATVNPGPIEGRDTSTMLSQINCEKCQLH